MILLINPSFNIAREKYDTSLSVGLLSIASFLAAKNLPVKILDAARQSDFWSLLEAEAGKCSIAALSVMTTQIPGALKISHFIREKNSKCRIVWGGTHPTFFPEQTVAHSLIDAVVLGEGEETLFEIAGGRLLSQIRGVAYKDSGRAIVNPSRPLIDPVKTPALNWALAPREILLNLALVPSLTSRGCPHRCSFCVNAILKNRWRPRTAEQVLGDLKNIKNNPFFWNKPVRFWDENFFVDIGRAKKIVNGMIEKGLTAPWETTVRAGYFKDGMIDDVFLRRMKQSGCHLLSFGAESGSSEVLRKIQKDITPEEIVNSAKKCLARDIIPQYSFMIGLPGETRKDIMLTLGLIDKLTALSEKVQILGPQAFRPYPGSLLYRECLASGWREPESLEEWNFVAVSELSYLSIKKFPWVTEKDLVESMEAYVRFGAHSFRSALGSSVAVNKLLKLIFILIAKARWKLKFFFWPLEFKIAKKFISM